MGGLGIFSRVRKQEPLPTYLIIGLGNPGREYRGNRHNVGFMAIDTLCEAFGVRLSRMQSKALIGSTVWNEKKIIMAKPQTFMNLSGQAVGSLLRFYKAPNQNLLVIHDDLDLPLGTIRMRPAGGSAGQKGLASIIQQLGTNDFPRMRVGIGRPPGRMDPSDYVLQDFNKVEQEILQSILGRIVDATKTFLQEGIEPAMNQFNGAMQED